MTRLGSSKFGEEYFWLANILYFDRSGVETEVVAGDCNLFHYTLVESAFRLNLHTDRREIKVFSCLRDGMIL